MVDLGGSLLNSSSFTINDKAQSTKHQAQVQNARTSRSFRSADLERIYLVHLSRTRPSRFTCVDDQPITDAEEDATTAINTLDAMAEANALEALQALHTNLVALAEHRIIDLEILRQLLDLQGPSFKDLLDKPARRKESRDAVQSGKIKVFDEEYSINKEFQESILQLADELDLDELEAAKLILESQSDRAVLGRSLVECALIRFHQQRKYLLDCMRLCIELSDDDELEEVQQAFGEFAGQYIFGVAEPGAGPTPVGKKFVPRCMAAMQDIKNWLQKLSDRITSLSVMYQGTSSQPPELQEAMEFSRLSLLQQHETLAVLFCAAIDKRHAEVRDFENFLQYLKKVDRYDHLLAHLVSILGVYIRVFGSTEGIGDLVVARQLNGIVCKQDDVWSFPLLHAAVRTWWIAEYGGWYVDDQMGPTLDDIDVDKEDEERAKDFAEALKEGAFDFLLAVIADVRTKEWQDPSRVGVQQWLQRKSPPLGTEPVAFSDFYQICLATQYENFIDAFISNLPDVLRKMRVEEDEQRQLSQTHEQDLDLERFLLMISYSYDGRPEAAEAFWSDPESNLAGFVQWASRRASTPLVSAFCEMLQAISENEACADAAHAFLLDEGHQSSAKMRKSQSLSWNQIFRELDFFSDKIRDRPTVQQSQVYRTGKPSSEQAETEPESAMMLECYLRLISKLASNSEEARQFLLKHQEFSLVTVIFHLSSSMIPRRLRACGFYALKALLCRKSTHEGYIMWECLDRFVTGQYAQVALQAHHVAASGKPVISAADIEVLFNELGSGFEQSNAFIQLILSLTSPNPSEDSVNDTLPFPENLGSAVRMPGIEPYVDFVLGTVLAKSSKDVQEVAQLRVLRLTCLEFALVCLETFNENLILIGNETNIAVDSAISTTDLATYVRLHPFARVMEWMFNGKVMEAIFSTIHQESADIGSAGPDSPLIQGIIRAVEVILKVLELQDTYLDLVRQVIRLQSSQRQSPVTHSAYASFEEGIMNHLDLITDLGRCCGLGHPALTLACLKLLEKLSTSSKVISGWNPGAGRQAHRNKAIVALEKNDEATSISGALVSELMAVLNPARGPDSPNFMIKIFILDFLGGCLQASPDQPTIAHLLLGFRCGANTLSVQPDSPFESGDSLFHNILRIVVNTSLAFDDSGIQSWLVLLKSKAMRVIQILWNSPLSSALVVDELRVNDFLFLLLQQEVALQPDITWDGQSMAGPEFLLTDASLGFVEFLALRSMVLEYAALELCSVSQGRHPKLKRRIFDALNGRVVDEGSEPNVVPTVFDLYDFLPTDGQWDIPPPEFVIYKDLDLRTCIEQDANDNTLYDVAKVREILYLKRQEVSKAGQLVRRTQDAEPNPEIVREETLLVEYLVFSNRQKQLASSRLRVLRSWTKLLLIMFEANEFRGTAKTSFLLQALQSILPNLEVFGSEQPEEAQELARLAQVLLFKIDLSSNTDAKENNSHNIGNLVSDKLFQLFQTCLYAIGKWAGNSDLRATYYSICYRYLTGIVDEGQGFLPGRQKTIKAIQMYGERLLNVVCDDACGSDLKCQTAALILLGAFVNLGKQEDDTQIVETLNRLNFIGVLVDSLKTLMSEALEVAQSTDKEQMHCLDAKLALLLQLCQTRDGAKFVLQANLFRSIELSGLFSADPELQIDPSKPAALAQHYAMLVKICRIIGAAVLSRGSHNVIQGRRFLTEHRMLVAHVLKRSAGIGATPRGLEERIEDLADAFMVLITATGFLEFEDQAPVPQKKTPVLFH
ncbi:uncharacterized protein E0L32_009029 [Thyridium curvatum]|uniref:Uncharacterized protein n=1 Tax=Thyridium curvatum TaxID=1093900 RepID=A0A507AYE5_9PEZI|nr:uncharacterized protein E0L32_009029 [Thyridium curvatum]TPX09838.1 hypothetical protein E0L32_009029 [Thyridium curvatum]